MQSLPRTVRVGLLLPLLSACVATTPSSPPAPSPADVGYRIVDTATGSDLTLGALADALSRADVVLFGEMHRDSVAHVLQLELMRELDERATRVTLGMEMLERDVQPAVDAYLRGELTSDAFQERARVWSNYPTDYSPLVKLARERKWPVLATNLPQELASLIAREGLGALEQLPQSRRRFAAAENRCPSDEYWDRFVAELTSSEDSTAHPVASASDPVLRRMYEAQCARDEAMAETITAALNGTAVYHVNGAFHSDFRLGIVPRLLRRRPELRVTVVSAVQVPDPGGEPLAEHLNRADYLIFTPE